MRICGIGAIFIDPARQLSVAEPPRRGAPMTLIRGGEEQDLQAIVAMGEVRARDVRFHLNLDVDFVQHAITRKRAWLPPAFGPPQVTIVKATPPARTMRLKVLGSTSVRPPLSADDVLYWRSDML